MAADSISKMLDMAETIDESIDSLKELKANIMENDDMEAFETAIELLEKNQCVMREFILFKDQQEIFKPIFKFASFMFHIICLFLLLGIISRAAETFRLINFSLY